MSKTNMHHIDDCADKRTQSEVLAGTARSEVVPWRASTGVMRALTPILVLLLATSEAFGWVVKTSEFSEGRMKNPDQSNFAFAPASPAAGPKLLLFLAGSGAKLEGYTDFMEEAAKDGYYVIGLAYRNDHSHTDLCGCMAECMGLMEQQNVTGIDNGFYSGDAGQGFLPKYNSIDHRFSRFVNYLKDHNVDGGHFNWTQFLDANGDPRWSKIVVAGHSGGGNAATWILKNKAPIAALTFSAPNANLYVAQPTDASLTPWTAAGSHGTCTKNGEVPDWITSGFGAHLLVYDDARDEAYAGVWSGHNIPAVIGAIGGLTELRFSDGGAPSGRWITRVTDSTHCGGNNPHHSEPISNCAGQDAGGRPRHHGVWDYMLKTALTF
jgi:hypothetical protein